LHSAFAGPPITFKVGPVSDPVRYDLHHSLLSTVSPLFSSTANTPHAISLSSISISAFFHVCTWLYYRRPPVATTASDLFLLMKIWVALSKLGFWDKQNTILRLGMAPMQPKDFVCEINAVK
jgi:hypothetical protein